MFQQKLLRLSFLVAAAFIFCCTATAGEMDMSRALNPFPRPVVRHITTPAGTIIGVFPGGNAGGNLDSADQQAFAAAVIDDLHRNRGARVFWHSDTAPHTGGFITLVARGQDSDGHPCRRVHQQLIAGGEQQDGYDTMCQMDDGVWRVVGLSIQSSMVAVVH